MYRGDGGLLEESGVARTKAIRVILLVLMVACSGRMTAQEPTIHDRMFHSRAVDAVVWAMPLLNFAALREAKKIGFVMRRTMN